MLNDRSGTRGLRRTTDERSGHARPAGALRDPGGRYRQGAQFWGSLFGISDQATVTNGRFKSLPIADEESAPARGDEMVPGGHLRATHDDRNRVVEMLRVAAGDGQLTLEELDERVGAALTARTHGELAALVSDLSAAPESSPGASAVKPKDVLRIDCHSATTRRDGPWMVPRCMEVRVTGGSVTLDFTEAVTWWPSLQLDTEVRGGSLRLVTKPGILVSTDDLAVRAGSVKVHAPWGSEVPVRLRIDVAGTVASGSFKARPPRRTLWQRLRRRPIPSALPPSRT